MDRATRKAQRARREGKRPGILETLQACDKTGAVDAILAEEARARADAWARSVDGAPYGCVDLEGREAPR